MRPRPHLVPCTTTSTGSGAAMRGVAVLVLAGLVVLGACGSETEDDVATGGDDPTLPGDPSPGSEPITADLEITAGVADDTDSRGQALLRCGPAGATGVLWLEGEAAEEACRALEDPALVAALEPQAGGQVCTELYGGPDVATIAGTVDGLDVDAAVDRTDGCGISRWDALAPLLPEPVGA